MRDQVRCYCSSSGNKAIYGFLSYTLSLQISQIMQQAKACFACLSYCSQIVWTSWGRQGIRHGPHKREHHEGGCGPQQVTCFLMAFVLLWPTAVLSLKVSQSLVALMAFTLAWPMTVLFPDVLQVLASLSPAKYCTNSLVQWHFWHISLVMCLGYDRYKCHSVQRLLTHCLICTR